MKEILNKNSSNEEFLKSLALLKQKNVNNEEVEIIEKIIKINKRIKEHPNQNFSKEKNKLLKKLKIIYIKQVDKRRLQDALLRSIIEQNVNYKFFLEDYYRQTVIWQNDGVPSQVKNNLMNNKELLRYILEFESYDEFLLSKNISKYLPIIYSGLVDGTSLSDCDNNFELLENLISILQITKLDFQNYDTFKLVYTNYIKELLLYYRNNIYIQMVCQQKLCDALLKSIIDNNIRYKQYLELYYREVVINHTDKITEFISNELINNVELLQYILEFDSYNEYLKSKKLI